jgi:hypothetical protein
VCASSFFSCVDLLVNDLIPFYLFQVLIFYCTGVVVTNDGGFRRARRNLARRIIDSCGGRRGIF